MQHRCVHFVRVCVRFVCVQVCVRACVHVYVHVCVCMCVCMCVCVTDAFGFLTCLLVPFPLSPSAFVRFALQTPAIDASPAKTGAHATGGGFVCGGGDVSSV